MSQTLAATWVLGTAPRDLCFLLLPGWIAIGASLFTGPSSQGALLLLVAANILDGNHVMATAWRTFLYPAERTRSPIYLWVPLGLLAGTFAWQALRAPGMWTFVAYAVLLHQIRQSYGLIRWYERLNLVDRPFSNFVLYSLCAIPILIAHFPNQTILGIFFDGDLPKFGSDDFLGAVWVAYAGVALAWVGYESVLWARGVREINRVLAIFATGVTFGLTFAGTRYVHIGFGPFLLAHAIQYLALVTLALHRTRPEVIAHWTKTIGITLALSALVLGIPASYLHAVNPNYATSDGSIFGWLITSAFLTPLLFHYFIDGVLWRRSHWESSAVYQTDETR